MLLDPTTLTQQPLTDAAKYVECVLNLRGISKHDGGGNYTPRLVGPDFDADACPPKKRPTARVRAARKSTFCMVMPQYAVDAKTRALAKLLPDEWVHVYPLVPKCGDGIAQTVFLCDCMHMQPTFDACMQSGFAAFTAADLRQLRRCVHSLAAPSLVSPGLLDKPGFVCESLLDYPLAWPGHVAELHDTPGRRVFSVAVEPHRRVALVADDGVLKCPICKPNKLLSACHHMDDCKAVICDTAFGDGVLKGLRFDNDKTKPPPTRKRQPPSAAADDEPTQKPRVMKSWQQRPLTGAIPEFKTCYFCEQLKDMEADLRSQLEEQEPPPQYATALVKALGSHLREDAQYAAVWEEAFLRRHPELQDPQLPPQDLEHWRRHPRLDLLLRLWLVAAAQGPCWHCVDEGGCCPECHGSDLDPDPIRRGTVFAHESTLYGELASRRVYVYRRACLACAHEVEFDGIGCGIVNFSNYTLLAESILRSYWNCFYKSGFTLNSWHGLYESKYDGKPFVSPSTLL